MLTKLRLIREGVGIKQKDLAKRTGLSAMYISMLEKGQRKASLKTQEKIVKVLNAVKLKRENLFD